MKISSFCFLELTINDVHDLHKFKDDITTSDCRTTGSM